MNFLTMDKLCCLTIDEANPTQLDADFGIVLESSLSLSESEFAVVSLPSINTLFRPHRRVNKI